MKFNHILKVIAVLIVLSFVFFSGCTSLSGNDRSVTPASEGQSYPSSVSGDGSGKTIGDTNSYMAPIIAPVPTTSTGSNAYTSLTDRKVIMTASVVLETDNHDKVVNSVRSIATGSGGYIESSSTWLSGSDKKHTSITLKVPQSAYESDLAQIKALGKVKSESSSGQDVTRQYVDLNARLSNLKAEEQQLSSIMGMSKNVSEVLSVEKELYRVRGEIESAQAQLNYLGSQVDFSTITVQVAEPEPVVGYDWGIDEAFRDASHAFVGMIGGLIVVTGYLIPLAIYFLIAAVILYFVGKFAWGYYKKRQAMKEQNKKV
jgi:hypothetical protein